MKERVLKIVHLKIQAIQRGRSERKKIENLKEEHKKVKRHKSATKIQSLVLLTQSMMIFRSHTTIMSLKDTIVMQLT